MAVALRPLALTMGDPAGCGPSITEAAWHDLRDSSQQIAFYVRAPASLFQQVETEIISDPSDAADVFPNALPVISEGLEMPVVKRGVPSVDTAGAITGSIQACVEDVLEGRASAVVTNPISKALLAAAGFPHPGHTEFLAELCRADHLPQPVMMLVGGGLRVALATIHLPLRKAIEAISYDLLLEIGEITHRDLMRHLGLSKPRIAFTGLNPHAGEDGLLGQEERDIINPAAETLRHRGINISDARPADTVFAEALDGRFDAVIAMTHDQGLIPVKTLDMWNGVNTTLGLPIIRTSPDHGTAYDAAAAGTARPDSLIAALKLAANMARMEQLA